MTDKPIPGLVLRARAGFYDVETATGVVQAQLRGRLRREIDEIAIGDRVEVRTTEGGKVMIEGVQPRDRVLSRRDPGRKSEQVLIANPDQAVFVFACADPDPNFRLMDRLLVMAESQGIRSIICANKVDLVKQKSAKEEFGEYSDIGYVVLYTSALKGKGIKALRKQLRDRISVFAGPSGVGKSTLLNAVQPGLGLETKEVSDVGLGAHTTVVRELLPLEIGGYVADSPGLRAFALWDIEPEELDGYMPDLAALVDQCEFNDCTHTHEPRCAVIAAVEEGRLSPERYDSYIRMREGDL
ncbi:MAG: ribosome small subunit-dependent GTPase A [Anaerolineales bacterium]